MLRQFLVSPTRLLPQARSTPFLSLSVSAVSINKPFICFVFSSTPKSSMSERRSINDVLMASARAAATRKKVRPPLPKKPKTLVDKDTTTQSENNKQQSEESLPKKPKTLDDKDTTTQSENNKQQSEEPSTKKAKTTVEDLSLSFDDRIAQLKKKASDFKPKSAAFWKDGEPVPFLFLARAFDLIGEEKGRIAITELLCNVFRTVMATTPGDLIAVVYLSANKVAPSHEGIELGLGDSALTKVLAEAYGRSEAQIKKQTEDLGDLGFVAKASRLSQSLMFKPKPLTVARVFDSFRIIAKESGKDSQDKKRRHIRDLLIAATDCEPQYLIRLLQSKLRIGLAEQTLLVALGHAAVYSEQQSTPSSQIQSRLEEAAKIVKQAYSVVPIYDRIVSALLGDDGIWKLSDTCCFTLGVPVGPMLAKPTKGVSEILDKFQGIEFTCEYKYDGERAQIHYMEDGSVEIYSRNAERNTAKFPDVVLALTSKDLSGLEWFRKHLNEYRVKKSSVKSFVLDCEVVAYDREKRKIQPFQILSTRARKGVALSDIKVDVCVFAFDLLYINGRPLLQEQLNVRRQHLYDSFEIEPGVFEFAKATTSDDLEVIQKFLEDAVESSSEGLILKTLNKDATYEPSKRSHNWLKLKKDYMDSIGDSLDLVPIAAFHGRGKRTGVYGAFLLACYDDKNEEFQSICKIGTGFSEATLEECSNSLRIKVIPKPKPYYRCGDSIDPDVWFEPSEVWEVKAADLTISPVHCAGIGIVDPNKGISLRFPRLVRIRKDKIPEQATSSDQVADMYRAQKHNGANNQNEDENEDD